MAAQHHANPSRRTLLAGVAAVSATATLPALPALAAARLAPASAADTELLQICADWRRAMDINGAVVDRLSQVLTRDWSDDDHAEWNETGEALSDAEERVFETKATTLAGVKAKAGVLDYMAETYGIPAEPEYAASLVADVLALTSGAA